MSSEFLCCLNSWIDTYIFNNRRLYKDMCSQLWEHSLDRQHTKLVLRGNTLIQKIEAWTKYQLLYMPTVARLRENTLRNLDHSVEVKAHDVPLWLPSQIRSQIAIPESYRRLEFDLRIPQASEALDELRAQLQVRAHLFKVKDRFIRGQAANTRARGTLDGIQKKIDRHALEYRTAYGALCCLGLLLGKTSWRETYLPLLNEDIRDLSEGKARQSEGRREISWIWRSTSLDQIDKPEEGHYREGCFLRCKCTTQLILMIRCSSRMGKISRPFLSFHRRSTAPHRRNATSGGVPPLEGSRLENQGSQYFVRTLSDAY